MNEGKLSEYRKYDDNNNGGRTVKIVLMLKVTL
jgi:hypothetical protein